MTSFSAVCVAENRATLVYVRPRRFASAKISVSRSPAVPLGCTTQMAPSRAIAAAAFSRRDSPAAFSAPRKMTFDLGAKRPLTTRAARARSDSMNPLASSATTDTVCSGLHVQLVDQRLRRANLLRPFLRLIAEHERRVTAFEEH